MPRRVLFSIQAQADVDDLYDYIADSAGYSIAGAYTARLDRYVRSFSDFPERGTRHDHVRPGLRITGFERRVTIAFTVSEDAVSSCGCSMPDGPWCCRRTRGGSAAHPRAGAAPPLPPPRR